MTIQKFDILYAIEPFDRLRAAKVVVFIKTYRLTDLQTYRLTDLQTYRLTDLQTYRLTDLRLYLPITNTT